MVRKILHNILLFDGLRNVAIACGAAHLWMSMKQPRMNELALSRYYRAIREVSRALPSIDGSGKEHYEAVQTAIMFLYIHGLLAIDTNQHIQSHVDGAIQLLTLKYATSKALGVLQPFHYVMYESILYQVFRRAVRYPFIAGVRPNMDFVAEAQKNLQTWVFPEASRSENTPIIGIPLQLQRLIIDIAQFCRPGSSIHREAIFELQLEIRHWEDTFLSNDDLYECQMLESREAPTLSEEAHDLNQIPTTLHILAASVLLEWARYSADGAGILSQCGQFWQVRCALTFMKRTNVSEAWKDSYLGLWPGLIIGYAVDTSEDVVIVRNSLQRAHKQLCGAEVAHYLHELESTWYMRGLSPNVPAWLNEIATC